MFDLRILVADSTIEVVIKAVLARYQSLGLSNPLNSFVIVHDGRDPGVYSNGHEFLRNAPQANYTIVILDSDWEGAPPSQEIQNDIRENLIKVGINANNLCVIVIEPEIEKWVWVDNNNNFLRIIDWSSTFHDLKERLEMMGFEFDALNKPTRPKEALEVALQLTGRPFSSAIHKEIAEVVSLSRCQDPSFTLFRSKISEWFGPGAAS